MSVRFVIGRAGSGKTHHCLEAIRRRLAADYLNGPRLIFLVPEQASQQMKRAILLPRGPAGPQDPIAAVASQAPTRQGLRIAADLAASCTPD